MADVLEPGDALLLGTDLVKSADRLIAAYDDPTGRDRRVRPQLAAGAQPRARRRLRPRRLLLRPLLGPARWSGWTSSLRSETPQRVTIPGAELVLDLALGEEIRVEISTKFRVSKIAAELESVGLTVARVWTDDPADFALTLAVKP